MSIFRVIPVVDILNSSVVHAIKGERSKYKKIKSRLIDSSDPLEIIRFFNQSMSFNEIYIADLDAIIHKKPNFDFLSEILKLPDVKIMLDPGIITDNDIIRFSEFKINKLIFGLETINELSVIKKGLDVLGPNRLILSLDMYKEKILSNIKDIKNKTPLKVIDILWDLGVKEIILLDLFRVGQKAGGIPPLYAEIRNSFEGAILVGGGIKDLRDIIRFKNENFSGVLVATALHEGLIKMDDVNRI